MNYGRFQVHDRESLFKLKAFPLQELAKAGCILVAIMPMPNAEIRSLWRIMLEGDVMGVVNSFQSYPGNSCHPLFRDAYLLDCCFIQVCLCPVYLE